MRIKFGCELAYALPQTTPMIVMLNVHYSRAANLERPDHLTTYPAVPIESYRDSFGNWCCRLVAPAGRFVLGTDSVIRDDGRTDSIDREALQHQVQHLPSDTLLFLLGSRYCETDRLSEEAWRRFGPTPLGWPRVQATCDFVHKHIVGLVRAVRRLSRRNGRHWCDLPRHHATCRVSGNAAMPNEAPVDTKRTRPKEPAIPRSSTTPKARSFHYPLARPC